MAMTFKELGDWGEEYAANRLRECGYTIEEKKFRCKEGEIDIVARQGKLLIFVEVKTRRMLTAGYGREAVTPSKQRKIRTAALRFMELRGLLAYPSRFDVAEITLNGEEVEWCYLPNAF